MEGETFDDLVKRLTAARLSRLDALRGVLASAAVGLAGATRSAEETAAKKRGKSKGKGRKGKGRKGKGKAERQPTVTLCHKPGTPAEQTKEVPPPAVAAHLGHGDTLGPCGATTTTTTTTAAPTTTTTTTTTTVAPTTTTTVGPNQPCETFVCGNTACADPGPSGFDCFCFELVADPGNGLCLFDFPCDTTPSCVTTADCPTGATCVTNTCCGQGVQRCAPACPENGTTARGARTVGARGPRASGR